VTLVDRRNHHLFQPLLYQVAMAGLSPADIAVPIRSVLHRQRNAQVLLGDVTRIDLDARQVHLADGAALPYDYLVMAAGARHNYFGHEAKWQPHALGLKSIEDALEMRRRVLIAFEHAEREPDPNERQRLMTFVVIGGGPTGVEVAGALAELARYVLADDFRVIEPRAARVILVEARERLVPSGFHPKLAEAAMRQLNELGVEVRLETRVEDIDAQGVRLDSGTVPAATVLWTAGVQASELNDGLPGKRIAGGRVRVTPDCSLPGHPEVFAIGDAAAFIPEGHTEPLAGVAPVAIQQGIYVARAIRARLARRSIAPFSYLDKGIMATVGRSRAITQAGRVRLSGYLAWVTWLFVHIYYLVGFRNRIAVIFNWFWSYMTYRRGARLITGGHAE
jgi:NADH dehydrogenase